jgi:hypothetical protein
MPRRSHLPRKFIDLQAAAPLDLWMCQSTHPVDYCDGLRDQNCIEDWHQHSGGLAINPSCHSVQTVNTIIPANLG